MAALIPTGPTGPFPAFWALHQAGQRCTGHVQVEEDRLKGYRCVGQGEVVGFFGDCGDPRLKGRNCL